MKHKLSNRVVALLLCVCLLVTIFAGLIIVAAQTGTLGKNTASRHVTCTSLSSKAQAYYTAGTYDYATISAMHGVYSTDSWTVTQNNPVYSNLQRLMIDTHTNTNVAYSGYGTTSLAYYWNYTDCISSSADYVLFYCDKLMNNVHEKTGRDGMEREHVWCKSKGDYVEDSNSAGADLHHMRPSYGYINGIKSDRAFANVTNGTACTLDGVTVFTYASGGTSGWMEVNDNIKGDIARILLYVYVRWGQPNLYSDYGSNISQKLKTAGVNTSGTINGSDNGSRIIESLDTLLEWMEIDPVDTWEMQRNDQIENVQGNRNVFIDYPEYAWIMFGMADQMPTDMDTPSGMAKNGAPTSYAVTKVNVNNSNWGSAVITNGNTVTVTPNAGYRLNTATATSGTVSISGNVITVTGMHANATVNVVFEAIPTYTVSYSTVGTVTSTASVYQGSSLTLPATASNINGYTFLGWVNAPVDPESTTQPTALTGSYTPTKNTTLYALYQREAVNPDPRPAGYTLTDAAPVAGETVVLARKSGSNYYALTTAGTPGGTKVTVTDGEVSSAPNAVWTVTAANTGVYLQPSGAGTYLHIENGALSVTSGTANAEIIFSSNADGTYKAARSDGERYIVFSGTTSFGSTGVEGNSKLYIFKYHLAEGDTRFFYTTMPECLHSVTELVRQVAATCTTNGYTGDIVCSACGEVITAGTVIPMTGHTVVNDPAVAATCTANGKTAGSHCSVCHEVLVAQTDIPALGHAYSSEITTAATCGAKGVKTFTCSRCHNTYTQDIPATGNHSYDNGRTTTAPGCTTPGVKTFTCTVCGKTRTETVSPTGHNYTSEITTAATCGANGVRTYTCSHCHDSYTETILATGNHSYTSSITTAPTCTTAGVTTFTCSVCGANYTQPISATGHNIGSATNTNNASYHTYYCQNAGCNYSYTVAHNFTVTISGSSKTYTCSDCGYFYTSTLNNYVVTYLDRGQTSSVNVTEGSSVTPPAAASDVPGYTFAGWSFTPYDEETTSAVLQTEAFIPTGDTTLYAVYARTEEGGDGNTYNLVTDASQLENGKKVIIAAKDYDFAMSSVTGTYYRAQAAITKNGNKAIISDDVHTFTLSRQNSKWSLYDNTDSNYLTAYVSGSYYDLGTENQLSSNGKFTISVAPGGSATICSNNSCYIRYIRDSYEEFVCRSAATDDLDIALYIEAPAETTYYTTDPYVKETYTVRFSELGTITDTESVPEGSSISLPDTATAASDYTFLGWVDAQIYNETTSEPVILTGSYTPTASTTLYAVYMRTQPGEGPAASLVKMNTGDTLNNGDKIVVIADGTNYVMYQQTRSGSYVMYKGFTNDTLTARDVAADDKYYFDVTKSGDGWILGDATNGYIYNNRTSSTSSYNNLCVSTDSSSVISVTDNGDGTFTMTISGRYLCSRTDLTTSNANYYRLNTNTNGSYKLDLYKYTPGAVDTLYYTTNPTGTEECVHVSTSLVGAAEPTCTADGYTGDVVCDICGETVTEGSAITAIGHDYVETIISEATYLADGEMSYTCSRCEDTYTEAIPQLAIGNANNGDYRVVTETTDDLSGTYLIVYEEGSIAFNGSLPYPNASGNYQAVTVTDGVIQGSAAVDALAVTIEKVEGTDTYTILLGSGKYIGNGGNGADLNYNTAPYYNTVTIDESCNAILANASGKNTYYFRFNAATVSNRFSFYAASTGNSVKLYKRVECEHESTHLEDAVSATCTTAGFTGNTVCDDCGSTVTEGSVIPASGHSYNANGVCSACGDKLINITSAYLRLDEDIDVIYTAKVPEGATATMTFTMNGKTVSVADDGTHSFAFEGVNPQCMGDNIEATLTVSYNGSSYTCTKAQYSVRTYCVNTLADETISPEVRKLVSDTLAYGAAAQNYMSYKTGSLVNTGNDIENPTYSTFTSLSGLNASFSGTADNNTYWTAACLTLTGSVAMNFRFYAESIEGLSIAVSINGRTQTFTEFTPVGGKANVYEISFTGIKANEFGDAVTASFNNGQLGNTVSYSVNAYVCAKQADSNNALANLVKALYNYGAAAEACAE